MDFRHSLAALAILTAMLTAANWAGAETWERFRGPHGDGVARNQNLPAQLDAKKNLVWKAAIPGLGNSSPIVWNDQVFLQSAAADGSERSLLCLDAKTGKTVWEHKTPGKKANTHKKNTLASATPTTDGSGVYVATWDGKDVIVAAYTMKGQPMWEKNLGEFKSQHGPGASPVVYKDKLFYAFDMDGKAVMYAFDKLTGKSAWTQPRVAHRACYTIPRIIEKGPNGPELLVISTTAITSYNPDTGSRNWDWKWTFGGPKAEPLRTIGETIHMGDKLFAFSGTDSSRLTVGLDLPSAQGAAPVQVWDNKKDFPYVPSPIGYDGHIYFVNDRGFAGCFEPKAGKQVFLQRIPDATFTSSPVIIDGKLYAGSEEGDLVVIKADPKFEILATTKIGERIRATPAAADGRLYVRGENHLFCFGKKD